MDKDEIFILYRLKLDKRVKPVEGHTLLFDTKYYTLIGINDDWFYVIREMYRHDY